MKSQVNFALTVFRIHVVVFQLVSESYYPVKSSVSAREYSENRPFLRYLVSVSKRVLMQNFSYENEFDLHENEPVGRTHFRTKTRFDTEAKGNLEMAYCHSSMTS